MVAFRYQARPSHCFLLLSACDVEPCATSLIFPSRLDTPTRCTLYSNSPCVIDLCSRGLCQTVVGLSLYRSGGWHRKEQKVRDGSELRLLAANPVGKENRAKSKHVRWMHANDLPICLSRCWKSWKDLHMPIEGPMA